MLINQIREAIGTQDFKCILFFVPAVEVEVAGNIIPGIILWWGTSLLPKRVRVILTLRGITQHREKWINQSILQPHQSPQATWDLESITRPCITLSAGCGLLSSCELHGDNYGQTRKTRPASKPYLQGFRYLQSRFISKKDCYCIPPKFSISRI